MALNGRFSGTIQPTGTQTVAFHLHDALIRMPRSWEAVVFADPDFPGVAEWADQPGTRLVPVPFLRWRRQAAQLWEQFRLPRLARDHGCRVLHHPLGTCPRWSGGLTHVVTIHDLNFYHHPDWFSPMFRYWLLATLVPAIRRDAEVVAISDYVLQDVRNTLGISASRSRRIYNGLKPLGTEPTRSPVAGPRCILGVNLWQPHKNLVRLIEAFRLVRQQHPDLELHLAGRPQGQFRSQPALAAYLTTPGVQVLGYLSDADLQDAYRSAAVFCYPSLSEGFGLPVLEAMAAGAPVVTSNLTALPEIAGGAAILIDPLSPQSIADGVGQALAESTTQQSARLEAGQRVAASFTWQGAAQSYNDLFTSLLHAGSQAAPLPRL